MKKNNFINNVLILMFSQIIIKIVGLVYKLYLTNKEGFGDTGNAIYSAGFQIYAILLTLSSIGVPNAISKMVASKGAIGDNKGAYKILKIAIVLFGVFGFIGSLILYFFAEEISRTFLQIPEAKLTLQILSPSIFLVSVSSVLRGYFNGKNSIHITAKSQSIEQIFKTIFTIIIVEIISIISNKNTILMAAAATMATTLATIFSLFYLYIEFIKNKKNIWLDVKNSSKYKKEKVKNVVKSILIVTIPISISAFLSVATKSIDAVTIIRLMKKYMEEKEATNLYGILSGKIDTLITLPLSFNIAISTTLVPTIARMIAEGKQKVAKHRMEFSILISILIGLPCTAIMNIFSREILEILFPNATSGMEMLKLSSLNIVILLIMQTVNGAIQGIGKVKISVIALSIGVVVKFIVNILLLQIKKIGIYGAIISSIICNTISLIICLVYLKRNGIVDFSLIKMLLKPIIATSIMTGITYLIYNKMINICIIEISLIISLIIGIIIYVSLIVLLKILSKEDKSLIPYGEMLYRFPKKKKAINS